MLNDKVILITGGTGSFGQAFTGFLFKNFKPRKVIILSRDEYKQFEMAKKFPDDKYPTRYFLGDVRDKDRLMRAFEGVDYVIHAAALKQVPALEYNPFEAVKTNILGAQNVVEASIQHEVKRVIAVSTDKAVNPINLYGATKMAMEKLFIAANGYVGLRDIRFSAVRYGNVVGSRGSVIPHFLGLKKQGIKEFPVTDERMTRFWITLEHGVELVYNALCKCAGGEIFVPKIPSMRITDLVKAICPEATYRPTGIRAGEKIHETLIHEDEGRNAYDVGDYFVVLPQFEFETKNDYSYKNATKVEEGFTYRSNTNKQWLRVDELRQMIKHMEE